MWDWYYTYCPCCGEKRDNKTDNCSNCGSSVDSIQSNHIMEYYREKSRKLYGKDLFWLYLLFEYEIKTNPLFDESKLSKHTSYVLISNYNEIHRISMTNKPPKITQTNTPTFRDTESENVPRNIPKCPTCGSTNLIRISGLNRAASVFMFGIASSKIGKQFECKNCGYKW